MNTAILSLVSLLFAGGSGGNAAEKPPLSPAAVVVVDTIADISLDHGETRSVAVPIMVADGYHVQANPASDEFLIPLELQLDPMDGIVFEEIEYPEGVPYLLENSEDVLQTYAGTFSVKVAVTALEAGTFAVSGKVRYQACDARRCLFPSTVPFTFRIRVEESLAKELDHD